MPCKNFNDGFKQGSLSVFQLVCVMYGNIFSKRELIELYMTVDNDIDKKVIGSALEDYPFTEGDSK